MLLHRRHRGLEPHPAPLHPCGPFARHRQLLSKKHCDGPDGLWLLGAVALRASCARAGSGQPEQQLPWSSMSHAASIATSSAPVYLPVCLCCEGSGGHLPAGGGSRGGDKVARCMGKAGASSARKPWPCPGQAVGLGRRPGAIRQGYLAGFWLPSLTCATLASCPPAGGNGTMLFEEEINPIQHLRRF